MLFKEITVEEFAEIRAREAAKDAYDAGIAEGEQSGFSKGQKSGLKLGFSKGEKSGAAQKEREIAKNFKASGIPIDVIAKNTGLALKEVEEL